MITVQLKQILLSVLKISEFDINRLIKIEIYLPATKLKFYKILYECKIKITRLIALFKFYNKYPLNINLRERPDYNKITRDFMGKLNRNIPIKEDRRNCISECILRKIVSSRKKTFVGELVHPLYTFLVMLSYFSRNNIKYYKILGDRMYILSSKRYSLLIKADFYGRIFLLNYKFLWSNSFPFSELILKRITSMLNRYLGDIKTVLNNIDRLLSSLIIIERFFKLGMYLDDLRFVYNYELKFDDDTLYLYFRKFPSKKQAFQFRLILNKIFFYTDQTILIPPESLTSTVIFERFSVKHTMFRSTPSYYSESKTIRTPVLDDFSYKDIELIVSNIRDCMIFNSLAFAADFLLENFILFGYITTPRISFNRKYSTFSRLYINVTESDPLVYGYDYIENVMFSDINILLMSLYYSCHTCFLQTVLTNLFGASISYMLGNHSRMTLNLNIHLEYTKNLLLKMSYAPDFTIVLHCDNFSGSIFVYDELGNIYSNPKFSALKHCDLRLLWFNIVDTFRYALDFVLMLQLSKDCKENGMEIKKHQDRVTFSLRWLSYCSFKIFNGFWVFSLAPSLFVSNFIQKKTKVYGRVSTSRTAKFIYNSLIEISKTIDIISHFMITSLKGVNMSVSSFAPNSSVNFIIQHPIRSCPLRIGFFNNINDTGSDQLCSYFVSSYYPIEYSISMDCNLSMNNYIHRLKVSSNPSFYLISLLTSSVTIFLSIIFHTNKKDWSLINISSSGIFYLVYNKSFTISLEISTPNQVLFYIPSSLPNKAVFLPLKDIEHEKQISNNQVVRMRYSINYFQNIINKIEHFFSRVLVIQNFGFDFKAVKNNDLVMTNNYFDCYISVECISIDCAYHPFINQYLHSFNVNHSLLSFLKKLVETPESIKATLNLISLLFPDTNETVYRFMDSSYREKDGISLNYGEKLIRISGSSIMLNHISIDGDYIENIKAYLHYFLR